MGAALEAYLTSDEITPATSKFDAWVRGEATLTPQEQRGIEAFKDGARGACAGCHRLNEVSTNPEWTMFTDYGFDVVAVPRNRTLPNTRDRGGCLRPRALRAQEHPAPRSGDGQWCGSFRTPSLRNVAVRETFMHNAGFKTLRDVVGFYATRASPDRFYPKGERSDDLRPGTARTSTSRRAPTTAPRTESPACPTRTSTPSSGFWARSQTLHSCRVLPGRREETSIVL